MTKHPYHSVSPSPHPLLAALAAWSFCLSLVYWFLSSSPISVLASLRFLILVCFCWWGSVIHEATYLGQHTLSVQARLRIGIVLFIISEIFFFFAFFWAYLHCSLSPNIELGSSWPPPGIAPLSPLTVPLLNTIVLLSSGCTLTWSHSELLRGSLYGCVPALGTTIFLGVFFTILQVLEYAWCPFTMSDSSFGSCFFLATGFHGLHVFIGSIFLTIALLRTLSFHFTSSRHLGFLFSVWYWHFVDVVWLLLFLIFYVWGS